MSYKVKKGDTLSGIAKAHNMSLSELLKLNGISKDKANRIYVGQNIKISKSTSNSTNTPKPKDGTTKPTLVSKSKVSPSETVPEEPTTSNKFNTYITWTPTYKPGEKCGVDGCAKYANDTLREHKDSKGRKLYSWGTTGGDAWTRLSKGTAKIIYSGYEGTEYDTSNAKDREIYQAYLEAVKNNDTKAANQYAAMLQASVGRLSVQRNKAAADRFRKEFDSKTLDKNKTYMVNMYYAGSPSAGVAWYGAENGTTGTHTGNLYFDKDTGRWRVSHNIHGTVYDDDFIKIQGSRGKYGVTAIAEAVPIDYREEDKRADYRQRKPIRGWIRDAFNAWDFMMRNGGMLIPKAKGGIPIPSTSTKDTDGLPIPSVDTVPRRWWSGDYEYTTASPTGYDLSSMGIHRTHEGQATYGNSDSLPIAHSLQYVNDRIYDLADRYNLSMNEAKMLLGNMQAVMWNESGGGSSRKINSRTGSSTSNYAYNAKDNNPLYMLGVRTVNSILGRDTSEGYGRVKVRDLRKLPYYSKQTEQELAEYAKRSPQFSGLSTFASMAQRYHKLNDIFKDDVHLIYGEDGKLNDLGNALLHISHNQGFDNILKNYKKYKQTGDINELEQYKNFRYPRLSAQLIKGHTIDGSTPEQLEAAVVVADRK